MSQPSQPHPYPPAAPYLTEHPAPVQGPAHRRRGGGRLVVIVTAAVVLLGAAGGTGAYLLRKHAAKNTVAAHTRLVAPETLDGRPRVTQPSIQAGLDMAVAQVKEQKGVTSVVAGAYGDLAKQDLVIVVGAARAISDPGKALDPLIAGMGAGGVQVTGMTSIDPGPLGGVAKCGAATVAGTAVGVCAWADRASTGTIMVYFKTPADAKAEFPRIRGAVEQRT
jgi:hypothetical protein